MARKKMYEFLKGLNAFDTCIKFTFDFNKESILFFDVTVSLKIHCCTFENVPISAKIFAFI